MGTIVSELVTFIICEHFRILVQKSDFNGHTVEGSCRSTGGQGAGEGVGGW